jgi:hypothetical protein
MLGIPRDVVEHSLDIRARARPVMQHLRRFDEEKHRAIGKEVHKLMAAGFIKEVFHPEWLANPVLVKKKGGKWRMCVDYTGLNKACPKVPYPLPRINQIVDSTAGCETLSFRLSSNQDERIRPARDFFHHTLWHVLLYYYAIWLEECMCNLPKVHEPCVRRAHWLNDRGLCR